MDNRKSHQQAQDLINNSNYTSQMSESLLKESKALSARAQEFSTNMPEEVLKRKKTLQQFTGLADNAQIPSTREDLAWHYFNSDFYSNDREYEEVADICDANADKMIDVRPYMIETPYLA